MSRTAMSAFSREVFEHLCVPGPRLLWLREWLLGEVWTCERYATLPPLEFLQQGEREVNELEEVIAAAASRIYDELLGNPPLGREVRGFLEQQRPCAVVVFDGLSLREIPLVLRLAEQSQLRLVEAVDFSFAAVATETLDFIDQRLAAGRASPKDLPGRTALRQAGITAHYFDSPSSRQRLDSSTEALLLWSFFPDQTYSDSGARFPQHFAQMHTLLETAWMNTVQQIPPAADGQPRTILITSDHGYVYFGAGLSFTRSNAALQPLSRYLGGERFRRLGEGEDTPDHPDLLKLSGRNVAVIRGRVQTHPPGPASARLYKHGGLSLMEMLTPWVVLRSASL